MAIATVNPATGETVKTYDEMSEADVERCLADAAAAHFSYRRTSFDTRAGWMRRAAEILDEECDQIAAVMTTEMGKTLAAARQEVTKCATACRYYADHAAGFLADEPGFYYPPTVLAGITADMRVHREEVFGPVATLYRVPDMDMAIELANDTEFGLGANAWTNDERERSQLATDLDAGMVFINGNVTSYPQLPFGGIKGSGHGRELSVQGIREFCNIKSVWIGGSG